MTGKKPDYNLTVKLKGDDSYAKQVGVGWKDEFGGISIKLNPCVVISHTDDVWINLYLNKDLSRRIPKPPPPEYSPPVDDYGDADDDVPF